MRYFTSRLLFAVLTFAIGVTTASLAAVHMRGRDPAPVKAEESPRLNRAQSDADSSAWRVLLSFEDKDLGALDQQSDAGLQHAIGILTGKPSLGGFRFIPRLITKLSDAPGRYTYVLVEESPLYVIPGESRLRIHVFDVQGKKLSGWDCPSGWRIMLTGVKRARVPEIDRDVLEVGSRPSINGRDIARQYYALVGDMVTLIRLEDGRGEPVKNIFGAPNHTIGPNLAGRSAAEWEKALGSADSAETLSALTWLGGRHWDIQKPLPEYEHEELAEAQMADSVRSRRSVQDAIHKLATSKNRWVREAAELAMTAEVYR